MELGTEVGRGLERMGTGKDEGGAGWVRRVMVYRGKRRRMVWYREEWSSTEGGCGCGMMTGVGLGWPAVTV